jgi:PAS domain S-box-containing protein
MAAVTEKARRPRPAMQPARDWQAIFRALQESEERYRRLFEDDLTGDCIATPNGAILTCNPAFLRIFGFRALDEALATNIQTLYPRPEDYQEFVRLLQARGKLEHYECVRVRRDGVRINAVENAVGAFDAQGRLIEIKSYAFDNTERKRAEKGVEEAKERYRLLIELIPDTVWVSDEETLWFANPAAARLVGAASPQELIGRPVLSLFHPDSHEKVLARTRLVLAEGETMPLERRRVVRLDGSVVEVETTIGPCLFDGKRGVIRVSRDITERVRHEQELLRKDQELSQRAEQVERLNAALRVLLEHREQEARQKDINMRATLDKLVFPYLEGIKSTPLEASQRGFLEIIEANLREISSDLARELATWHEKLTPTEIQVADMVMAGKRSKEIAALLRISDSAVAFHRANVRRKLGLKNRSANLVSFLRSISKK